MPKNNRLSAAFDNQVSIFLVNYCEEAEGYEEKLYSLYREYQRVHRSIAPPTAVGVYSRRWMAQASFFSRLQVAGLGVRRSVAEKQTTIWITGVRVRPKHQAVAAVVPQLQTQTVVVEKCSHIRINGTLYERELVATMKPIRPFTKHTGEVMTHILTFKNAELRHQFISTEDAKSIEQKLGK